MPTIFLHRITKKAPSVWVFVICSDHKTSMTGPLQRLIANSWLRNWFSNTDKWLQHFPTLIFCVVRSPELRDGPWPDLTWPEHTFDLQYIRGHTIFDLRVLLTWPEDIFLTQREKIEKFWIVRENFPNPNPNQRWLTWPNPTEQKKMNLTQPGSKFFDSDSSLPELSNVNFLNWFWVLFWLNYFVSLNDWISLFCSSFLHSRQSWLRYNHHVRWLLRQIQGSKICLDWGSNPILLVLS